VDEEEEEVEAPMEAFDDDDAIGSCSSCCGRTWDVCFWGSWVLWGRFSDTEGGDDIGLCLMDKAVAPF
jgi:hypothetical protein